MKNFSYEKFIALLEDVENMNDSDFKEALSDTLQCAAFKEMMFAPKVPVSQIQKLNDTMFSLLAKRKVMNKLAEAIEEEGFSSFDRADACFCYKIINLAVASSAQRRQRYEEMVQRGDRRQKDLMAEKDKIEKTNDAIGHLLKVTKKIVKKRAKRLSEESGVPKKVCQAALYIVPNVEYIDSYKIGYYLNLVLGSLYPYVDANNVDTSNVKWRLFLKELFGENNVVEASTFILLEGVSRIKEFDSKSAVYTTWDDLTKFALKDLENAPAQIQTHMVELYTKRIGKMFANHTYDLRANLLALDKSKYPGLAETVSKYADKISEIMNHGKSETSVNSI